jgi:hypothetical protein
MPVVRSADWDAAVSAMKGIDRSFASAIKKYIKAMAEPETQKAVRSRARTKLQRRVLGDTATATVANSSVTMKAGSRGGPLSGGLSVSAAAAPTDFGSNKYKQFGPRSRQGKAFYPAAKSMVPRIMSLYSQTVIKTVALAMTGKKS